MTRPTRAAFYVRVSTDEQAKEGFSLSAQEDRLTAYAKAQGWAPIDLILYRDNGHSARTTQRPAYQALMADIESWDVLVVLKMDRLHRNSRNLMDMMETLSQKGKAFVSVTESLDTGSAMGRFVMDIIGRIAQLESEQIGERVEVGMRQKAKVGGGSLGGPAPFGYRWEAGKLVPNGDEAALVRIMFQSAEAGDDPGRIATRFNTQGYQTRQGKPWTYWNVKAILENRTYEGHTVWDGIVQRDTHQSLVPVS